MSDLDTAQDLGLHLDADLHAAHGHTWQMRGVDFEDGVSIRRFECVWCEAVRFD